MRTAAWTSNRVSDLVATAVRRNVRFQQKIAYVPALKQPVWIDDDKFNLRYHVRHTCLPAPGSERLLKRLAGRIMFGRTRPREGAVGDVVRRRSRGEPLRNHLQDPSQCGRRDLGSRPAVGHRGSQCGRSTEAARHVDAAPGSEAGCACWQTISGGRAEVPLWILRGGASALTSPGKTISAVRDAALGLSQAAKAGLVPGVRDALQTSPSAPIAAAIGCVSSSSI